MDSILESFNFAGIHIHLLQRGKITITLVILAKLVLEISNTGTRVANDVLVQVVVLGKDFILLLNKTRRRIFTTRVATILLGIEACAMFYNLEKT